MKNLFLILLTAISLHAGDVVTAVVVIDDSEQLTGINGASITVDSDTRIITNSVTSAATQILANTNLATAVFRLQTHIASYPFSGVRLSTTNNGIVLKGADGEALSVTISNAWASVTYRTNTYSSDNGAVVRIPYSDESTANQNVISDGLINWINIAPTNSIDEDATIADNLAGLTKSQIITGATTLSNVANVVYAKALQVHHSALTADSADTNFVADLLAGYRTITALGDLNFIQSTNRSAGRSILIRIDPSGTNRTLTFNSDWQFMGGAITTITNSTIGLLRLDCFGGSETNVHASYSVEGGFGSSGGASDTDDQTAAEVAFTPAGNISATDVQAGIEELDTEKLSSASIDTSAEIASIVGDETGTGALVLATSPTLVTPTLGVATATTVDTGQGANELYDMDQNVTQASSPTFSAVTVAAEAYDATDWDGDNTVPTKNDVRDKVEALSVGGGLGTGDIDTSAEIAGIVGDETGTGALVLATSPTLVTPVIGAATATTPSADDSDTSVATTAFVQGEINGDVRVYEFALSDETTAITTGTAKVTWRAPHAMTVTGVRASLSTVSSSGLPTVDINEAGTTILSTKLTIDASEKTSTTAATAAVISDTAIADDAEITFDIDTAGTNAAGLKVKIYYTK